MIESFIRATPVLVLLGLVGCGGNQGGTTSTSGNTLSGHAAKRSNTTPVHLGLRRSKSLSVTEDACRLLTATNASKLIGAPVSTLRGPRAVGKRACLAYSSNFQSSAELIVLHAKPSQGELRARAERGLHGIRFPHVSEVPNLGDAAFVGSGSPPPRPGEAALGPSVALDVLIGRNLYFLLAGGTPNTPAETIAVAHNMLGG